MGLDIKDPERDSENYKESAEGVPASYRVPEMDPEEPRIVLSAGLKMAIPRLEFSNLPFRLGSLIPDMESACKKIIALGNEYKIQPAPLDDVTDNIDLLKKMLDHHAKEQTAMEDPTPEKRAALYKKFLERRTVKWLRSSIQDDIKKIGVQLCDDIEKAPKGKEDKTAQRRKAEMDSAVDEYADILNKNYEAERETVELAEKRYANSFKAATLDHLEQIKAKRTNNEKIKNQYDVEAIAEFITRSMLQRLKKIMVDTSATPEWARQLYENLPSAISSEEKQDLENDGITIFTTDKGLEKSTPYVRNKVVMALLRARVIALAAVGEQRLERNEKEGTFTPLIPTEDALWDYFSMLELDENRRDVVIMEEPQGFRLEYDKDERKKMPKMDLFNKLHELDPDFITDLHAVSVNNQGQAVIRKGIQMTFPQFFAGEDGDFGIPKPPEGHEWTDEELDEMEKEYWVAQKKIAGNFMFLSDEYIIELAGRSEAIVDGDNMSFSSIEAAVDELKEFQRKLWKVLDEYGKVTETSKERETALVERDIQIADMKKKDVEATRMLDFLKERRASLKGEVLSSVRRLEMAEEKNGALRQRVIDRLQELHKKTGFLSGDIKTGIEDLVRELLEPDMDQDGQIIEDVVFELPQQPQPQPNGYSQGAHGPYRAPTPDQPGEAMTMHVGHSSIPAQPTFGQLVAESPVPSKPTFGQMMMAGHQQPQSPMVVPAAPQFGVPPQIMSAPVAPAPSIEQIVEQGRARMIEQREKEAALYGHLAGQGPYNVPSLVAVQDQPAIDQTAPYAVQNSHSALPFHPVVADPQTAPISRQAFQPAVPFQQPQAEMLGTMPLEHALNLQAPTPFRPATQPPQAEIVTAPVSIPGQPILPFIPQAPQSARGYVQQPQPTPSVESIQAQQSGSTAVLMYGQYATEPNNPQNQQAQQMPSFEQQSAYQFAQAEEFFARTEAYITTETEKANRLNFNVEGRTVFIEDTPLQFPDGNTYTVTPGTVKLGDGTIVMRDGTVYLSNGVVKSADGTITAPSIGVTKFANGAVRLASGLTKYPNGTIQMEPQSA